MEAKDVLKKYQNFAVIGISNDKEKYSYKIFQRLLELNKTVYGISPRYKEIDGIEIYPNLTSVPASIDVAVFVVNPKFGSDYVKECKALNITHLWLQPNTFDDDLIKLINDNELNYYPNCVLVESKNL